MIRQSTVLQRLLNRSSTESFFYTAKVHFTRPPPNASFCTNLCLWPLHGQVSLDKGSLAQCCGVRSVVVAHCESRAGIGAGASTFLNRGLRLRYWVVIVQVIVVGLRRFSAVFLI